MLICRQDTNKDQEVDAALKLLSCDQHMMDTEWLDPELYMFRETLRSESVRFKGKEYYIGDDCGRGKTALVKVGSPWLLDTTRRKLASDPVPNDQVIVKGIRGYGSKLESDGVLGKVVVVVSGLTHSHSSGADSKKRHVVIQFDDKLETKFLLKDFKGWGKRSKDSSASGGTNQAKRDSKLDRLQLYVEAAGVNSIFEDMAPSSKADDCSETEISETKMRALFERKNPEDDGEGQCRTGCGSNHKKQKAITISDRELVAITRKMVGKKTTYYEAAKQEARKLRGKVIMKAETHTGEIDRTHESATGQREKFTPAHGDSSGPAIKRAATHTFVPTTRTHNAAFPGVGQAFERSEKINNPVGHEPRSQPSLSFFPGYDV